MNHNSDGSSVGLSVGRIAHLESELRDAQVWLMPSFQRSVLPFFRSVATVAVAVENGNAGIRIHRDEETRTLIGCPPTAERQK